MGVGDAARMLIRRLALTTAIAAAAFVPTVALAAPQAPASAQDPASSALRAADTLAADWGRCATARPAHRMLAIAHTTRARQMRMHRAQGALRAWRTVKQECSKPVAQPQVSVGASGFMPAER